MSEFKPTEGPWFEDEYGRIQHDKHESVVIEGVALGGRSTTETRSNKRLLLEAGTVYHEIGLTPRQLAVQRDELLEALKLCKFDSLNMTFSDLAFIRKVYANATKGE